MQSPPNYSNAKTDYYNFKVVANKLFVNLIMNLEIGNDIRHLTLIPDGILNYIPFEVLLFDFKTNSKINFHPNNNSYLINKYSISYRYSSSINFGRKNRINNGPSNFVGYAPSFYTNSIDKNRNSCDLENLSKLNCNEKEVFEISQLLSGNGRYGKEATKSAFKNEIEDYQIVHFATHTCLNDEDPMLNRIFFSDTSISNYELYNLNLPLELAVLSACNTGSGQLKKGEGVISLSRGFFHAGCPSLLMSLWAVEDCTTSEIMNKYYANLKKGQDKDSALRNAKLEYLQNATKLEAHPFYWAPFIQLGDTAPIKFDSGFNYYYLLLGILALFFLIYFLKRILLP